MRMCLSIPARVVRVDGDYAEVDYQGVRRTVGITFVKDVQVGDYLLVHSGFAIEKMSEQEALETLECWEEVERAGGIG